jgi:opacity protein-like surface antigen
MGVLQRLFLVALVAAAIAAPISAEAQEGAAITFAAGAIGSTDPAPADHFVEPAYVVSFQGVFKRYFVIEGELSHWSHTLRVERGPHDVFGPEGRIGSVTGTTTVDSGSIWNFGANFLVRSTGRVRVFGGGGVSASVEDSEYSQESFGCSPSLDPRTCQPFTNARLRGPVPVLRVLGGVDVPLNERVSMFGSVRAETTAWEDRSNWLSGVAGVRFAFD